MNCKYIKTKTPLQQSFWVDGDMRIKAAIQECQAFMGSHEITATEHLQSTCRPRKKDRCFPIKAQCAESAKHLLVYSRGDGPKFKGK